MPCLSHPPWLDRGYMWRPSGQAQFVCSRQWVRVRGWCETVASMRGREPGSRGTSAVGSNVTENAGLCDSELWDRRQPARTEASEHGSWGAVARQRLVKTQQSLYLVTVHSSRTMSRKKSTYWFVAICKPRETWIKCYHHVGVNGKKRWNIWKEYRRNKNIPRSSFSCVYIGGIDTELGQRQTFSAV
jgi:hypothetical protein